MDKIPLFYFTIKYLKWKQIYFQVFYRIRSKLRKLAGHQHRDRQFGKHLSSIAYVDFIPKEISYLGEQSFRFLNIEHRFNQGIDWDYEAYGKLWTYNLNYFEYLLQEKSIDLSDEYNVLIAEFIAQLPRLKNANEPYPTSLRIMNWIKYNSSQGNYSSALVRSIYNQLFILSDQIEYHILGNHLLENGFALFMGGIYLEEERFLNQGFDIVSKELEEQILSDGGHYELSPMYHCIILERALDSINLFSASSFQAKSNYLLILIKYAEKMLAWLENMTYPDGSLPCFNDSSPKIAPTTKQLQKYAKNLGITFSPIALNDSGYRKIGNEHFDLFIKTLSLACSYQPGHAHADSLTFELRVNNIPFIVDTGISTYESNKTRMYERGTSAHNTVLINDENSSEIWGSFRIGRREKTRIIRESNQSICASKKDFKGKKHSRIWNVSDSVGIIDVAESGNASLHLHFAPGIEVKRVDNNINTNLCLIKFEGATDIHVYEYDYCVGFNSTQKSLKAIVHFTENLKTEICIENPFSI